MAVCKGSPPGHFGSLVRLIFTRLSVSVLIRYRSGIIISVPIMKFGEVCAAAATSSIKAQASRDAQVALTILFIYSLPPGAGSCSISSLSGAQEPRELQYARIAIE